MIDPFLSFGPMPIANGWRLPDDTTIEPLYPLELGQDQRDGSVKLCQSVPPEKLFHADYAFRTGTSEGMREHFARLAESVTRDMPKGALVVEIGSNDGTLLRELKRRGVDVLGVDPASTTAKGLYKDNIPTISRFFDEQVAREILTGAGPARTVIAANVLCHLTDSALMSALRGVATLLAPGGSLVFEDPYLGDILQKVSFDQVYDEHAQYFSATSVARLARSAGLELVNVQRQTPHGGSMRYTLARPGEGRVLPQVPELIAAEEALRFHDRGRLDRFALDAKAILGDLVALLVSLKRDGKRVVGYGATSESTTVLNWGGIGPDLVQAIVDTTPGKIGRVSPGMRIPAVSRDSLERDPDCFLLFAWNHAEEAMAKEADFRRAGGRFIVYVPRVKVV